MQLLFQSVVHADIVLNTEDSASNKTDLVPAFLGLSVPVEQKDFIW